MKIRSECDCFLDAMRACLERARIELTCNDTNVNPKAFVFEPQKLTEIDKVWYLTGYERGSEFEKQISLTNVIELRFMDSTNDDRLNSN